MYDNCVLCQVSVALLCQAYEDEQAQHKQMPRQIRRLSLGPL